MTTTEKNTLASTAYRNKFRLANLDTTLRAGLVAEKVCLVDRTENYTIQSPYGDSPTTTISVMTGTYAINDYTVTLSTLTVDSEFKCPNHVYDFEQTLIHGNMFQNRADEQAYSVMKAVDYFVVNGLAYGGSGSYSTPTGGFTTAANLPIIAANLISKVTAYPERANGMYLIVEDTDLVGIIPAMATSGFTYSDNILNNGYQGRYMNIDIYVVPSGTFVSATQGTQTWVNDGCRVFGVKNMATYAAPRGIQIEEKGVSGKTGKEIVTYGYCGVEVWSAKAALTVKIILA